MIKRSKIAIVLGAAYPSSKAYAVTTRETCRVLNQLGLQVKVYGNKSKYMDEDFKKYKDLNEKYDEPLIAKLLINFAKSGNGKFYFACWRLGVLLTIVKSSRKILMFNPDIIWTRDPMLALYCSYFLQKSNIFLEIHDKSGEFFLRQLLKKKNKIKYLPINKINLQFLQNINKNVSYCMAPMGIRIDVLANENSVNDFVRDLKIRNFQNLKIGYVGNFSPGGYSKGIEDLINLASQYQTEDIIEEVSLVGASAQELFRDDYLKDKNQKLRIVGHVNHSTALKLMKDFDVLILPEPLSKDYMGMPIKLLEYLSVGRIVIVANCHLFQSLFDNDYKPFFYETHDINSLFKVIQNMVAFEDLESHILSGVRFAAKFSWEQRTERILSRLNLDS